MLTLTWGIDMFEKLTPETGVNLKSTLCIMLLGVEISCKKPVFFFNIFSGDPDFDALIIGLCQIYLIIGQTFGEGTLKGVRQSVVKSQIV